MLEYDFIIVEDPKATAKRPQMGAIIVIPGKMNTKGKPNVQMLSIGFAIWTRKTIVKRMSSEKASE
jgi:hypothetical protein